MEARDALAEFDAWMEEQDRLARAREKNQQDERAREVAPLLRRERKSGFVNGPWLDKDIDAFLLEYRRFRADADDCPDCQRRVKLAEVSMVEPLCSLHMGWGRGIAWVHGE